MNNGWVIALLVGMAALSILDAWMFVHVYRARPTKEEEEE